MTRETLVTWVGSKDLSAARNAHGEGLGPIGQATNKLAFDHICLISNYSGSDTKLYAAWLDKQTKAKIEVHQVKLRSPTHHGDIYQQILPILDAIKAIGNHLTYHLSPGTPSMHAIMLLLAKTTHPGRMIQSSLEAGVEDAVVPLDIAAEFIPQLLEDSSRRLIELAQSDVAAAAKFENIIHRSAVMKRVIGQAQRAAPFSIPVLIEGESGTGKELMARAIHEASKRADKKFVPVNCGAIPKELVESEFFGHTKGAFTGAKEARQGHFELANGGTLFLDEIGELPLDVQVKLLRALQQGAITPVGASVEKKVDVRIIAATNRTLINEVTEGRFREDLFYRLAVMILRLPPLRDRSGDVSLLIDKLLEQVNAENQGIGFGCKKLSVAARNLMLQHLWPGNVRELHNTLRRAVVWADSEAIGVETMRDAILPSGTSRSVDEKLLDRPIEAGVQLEDLMGKVARHYLKRAIEHTHGSKSKAAELVGLNSPQTLTNWLVKYDVG